MYKNVAGQKIRVYAYDATTGAPVTGDAANITVYVAKDGGSVNALTDTSATELDATNAPGVYSFDVSQTESDAEVHDFTGKSTTSNVYISPILNLLTLPYSMPSVGRGTATSGGSITSIPTSAFSPAGAATDQFKARIITFDPNTTTAALRGQSTDIMASTNAATPTFTVSALTTAPASGDTFSVT